jgi:glutathione S-transferase
VVYLGKAAGELDPNLVTRGYAALDRMERHLVASRFLVGDRCSLADIALLAYTRVAHEGGFDLTRHASLKRWIGEVERRLGLQR